MLKVKYITSALAVATFVVTVPAVNAEVTDAAPVSAVVTFTNNLKSYMTLTGKAVALTIENRDEEVTSEDKSTLSFRNEAGTNRKITAQLDKAIDWGYLKITPVRDSGDEVTVEDPASFDEDVQAGAHKNLVTAIVQSNNDSEVELSYAALVSNSTAFETFMDDGDVTVTYTIQADDSQ